MHDMNRIARPGRKDVAARDPSSLEAPPQILRDFQRVTGEERIYPKELIAVYEPYSAAFLNLYSVYRQLRDRDRRRIAIISVDPGEGASFIAANLAVISSQHGLSTLLIDGNCNHPRQHRIFGVDAVAYQEREGPGLFFRPTKLKDFIDLSILPANLYGDIYSFRENVAAALQLPEETYDVIIGDAPSFVESDEALAMAVRMSGVLLVIRPGHTRRKNVIAAKEAIELAGGTLIGAVATNF